MEYIYVCQFSNGHTKVGRSIDPASRIATHASRVACLGVSLVDHCAVVCAISAEESEAALIDFCQKHAETRNANEWFSGLDYQSVLRAALEIANSDGRAAAPTGWAAYMMLIKRAGVTQTEMASRIGCAQPSLSNVLTGKTKDPSFAVGYGLLQIGRALGLDDPSHLFPIQPA
jgi:hypothetical protein